MRTGISLHTFLFIMVLCCAAHAQDSLMQRNIAEVPVYARSWRSFTEGSHLDKIDSLEIKQFSGASLATLLQQRSDLYIKSYGNGMSATPSFRGTGAEHTAVVWNGFNLNQPVLGLSDLSLISITPATEVQILHGSGSSLFGSGAIGGSILIDTKPDWKPQFDLTYQQGFASFQGRSSQFSGCWSSNKMYSNTYFQQSNAENNFEYYNIFRFGKPLEKQQNAAIAQQDFKQDLAWKFNKQSELSANFWYTKTNREVQLPIGTANNHAKQNDENLRLALAWKKKYRWGQTIIKQGLIKDYLWYKNDAIVPSAFDVLTYTSGLDHEFPVFSFFRVNVGVEWQYIDAKNTGYLHPISEHRTSFFILTHLRPVKKLDVSFNLRESIITAYNPPLTPSLGFDYEVIRFKKTELHLKAQGSKSYRVPTLNERYWSQGGNPNILPESGKNIEAALAINTQHISWTMESEVRLYSMLVDNWIRWTPIPAKSYWSPQNILQVQSQGVEFSTKSIYRYQDLKLLAGLSYAYINAINLKTDSYNIKSLHKPLIYVPANHWTSMLTAEWRSWILYANLGFTDVRYTLSDNSSYLDPYYLMNTSVGKKFRFKQLSLEILFKVNNATNTVYQTIENRAMPFRNYALNIKINFNYPTKK